MASPPISPDNSPSCPPPPPPPTPASTRNFPSFTLPPYQSFSALFHQSVSVPSTLQIPTTEKVLSVSSSSSPAGSTSGTVDYPYSLSTSTCTYKPPSRRLPFFTLPPYLTFVCPAFLSKFSSAFWTMGRPAVSSPAQSSVATSSPPPPSGAVSFDDDDCLISSESPTVFSPCSFPLSSPFGNAPSSLSNDTFVPLSSSSRSDGECTSSVVKRRRFFRFFICFTVAVLCMYLPLPHSPSSSSSSLFPSLTTKSSRPFYALASTPAHAYPAAHPPPPPSAALHVGSNIEGVRLPSDHNHPPAVGRGSTYDQSSHSPPLAGHANNAGSGGVGHAVNPEDVDDFKRDFEEFDANKDGVIDAYELRLAFEADKVEPAELYQFFMDVDDDDSGTVTENEYLEYAVNFST